MFAACTVIILPNYVIQPTYFSFVGATMACLIRGFSRDLSIKAGLRAAYQSVTSHYAVCPELSPENVTKEFIQKWAPWEPTQLFCDHNVII